jgi:hypothetical protein
MLIGFLAIGSQWTVPRQDRRIRRMTEPEAAGEGVCEHVQTDRRTSGHGTVVFTKYWSRGAAWATMRG